MLEYSLAFLLVAINSLTAVVVAYDNYHTIRDMGKFTKRAVLLCLAVLLVVAGIGVGWFLFNPARQSDKYPLLDPSVFNPHVSQELIDFDPLRKDIRNYLEKTGLKHSFYFEYLPNGVNIRDGSDSEIVAASLLKTTLVMNLYRLAEAGKLNLENTARITPKDISADPIYGDPSELQAGQTISLRNAAKIALQQSDNTAINVVRRVVQPLTTANTDVFESLDVTYSLGQNKDIPSESKTVMISARSYSSIFKCLYYSCFLQPKDSQEVLNNLIGSAGQSRLPAGVAQDKSIKVAHKIGSSTDVDSDCGIFYYPKKPYLVCLLFNGRGTEKPFDTDKYFRQVSKMVYDYIASAK